MNTWGDRQVVLGVVANSGLTLMYAPLLTRADREIVLAAVAQNGRVLAYASKELQADQEVALVAVGNSPLALQWAAPPLQANKRVVTVAVRAFGSSLEFAHDSLRADDEVVLHAVKSNGVSLEFASQELRNDADICLAAVEQNEAAVPFASESLRRDRRFLLACLGLHSSALTHAAAPYPSNAAAAGGGPGLGYDIRLQDVNLALAAIVQRGYEHTAARVARSGDKATQRQDVYGSGSRYVSGGGNSGNGQWFLAYEDDANDDADGDADANSDDTNGVDMGLAAAPTRADREEVLEAVAAEGLSLVRAGDALSAKFFSGGGAKKSDKKGGKKKPKQGLSLEVACACVEEEEEEEAGGVEEGGAEAGGLVVVAAVRCGRLLAFAPEPLKAHRLVLMSTLCARRFVLQLASPPRGREGLGAATASFLSGGREFELIEVAERTSFSGPLLQLPPPPPLSLSSSPLRPPPPPLRPPPTSPVLSSPAAVQTSFASSAVPVEAAQSLAQQKFERQQQQQQEEEEEEEQGQEEEQMSLHARRLQSLLSLPGDKGGSEGESERAEHFEAELGPLRAAVAHFLQSKNNYLEVLPGDALMPYFVAKKNEIGGRSKTPESERGRKRLAFPEHPCYRHAAAVRPVAWRSLAVGTENDTDDAAGRSGEGGACWVGSREFGEGGGRGGEYEDDEDEDDGFCEGAYECRGCGCTPS